MSEVYLHMGSLGRPHGISGEIALHWFGISPFSCALPLFVKSAQSYTPLHVENSRQHNGRLLLRLKGVCDRTQAEQLRGKKIFTPKSSLPPPEPDEAYISDLIGASVFLEDGTLLGTFSYLLEGTGRSVWALSAEDGREILFPAEPPFITELDVEGHRIVVSPPEGLLELYTDPGKDHEQHA